MKIVIDGLCEARGKHAGATRSIRAATDVIGAQMEFRVLGPVDLWRDGHSVPIVGRKQRTLLAVLVLHANQVVPHDRLLTALWGSEIPGSGRRLLHNHVWSVRRMLTHASMLTSTPVGYSLRMAPGASDLDAFIADSSAARTALAAGSAEQAAEHLRKALALWRGPALGGTRDELQLTEGAALEERRIVALADRIDADLALGRYQELISELRRLVADNPLQERLRAQLMLALHYAGRTAEALEEYRLARQHLRDELGLDPGKDLTRIHSEILSADSDLGQDASRVVDDPPRAVAAVRSRLAPRLLPADIARFTGRAAEVAHLLDGDPKAVVVEAIDGMAGVGKTALAVHAAHRLANRYPDGQLYIDLHGHTPGRHPLDAAPALRRLLCAVGVRPESIPDDVEQAAALWRAKLAERHMLVVLDNAASADQVRPLLAGVGHSKILITSRRRLTELEDASVLSLDVLQPEEAKTLFLSIVGEQRAGASRKTLADVLRLCGYLPLAIQITATRMVHRPAWTMEHLADRLGDEDRRMQELQVGDRGVCIAFTLSYNQLSTAQQRMFRLLSLVPGNDFDRYTAATLTGTPLDQAERLLEGLLDSHLLQQHTAGRYRFHDLLRDYAQQTCQAIESDTDRADVIDRLRKYYLSTAALAAESLGHGDPRTTPLGLWKCAPVMTRDRAAAWLETERDNLVAAALTCHDAWAVDISLVLWRYLFAGAHHSNALALYEHAADVARRLGDQAARIQVLINFGVTCWRTAQYEQALRHQQHALDISRRLGDRAAQSRALKNLGITCAELGRAEESNDHFEQALALARELNDRQRQSRVLTNLGINHERLGHYPRALHCLLQALSCAREIGDPMGEGRALNNLGFTYCRMGRYELGASHCQLALSIARRLGERTMETIALQNLGVAYGMLGRHQEALDHHHRSLTLGRQADSQANQAGTLVELGNLHLRLNCHSQAQDCHRQALTLVDESGDPVTKITALNGLGQAACSMDDPTEALDYHHQALALAITISHPYGQACAHRGLGDALYITQHIDAATEAWQQALNIFAEIGAPERTGLRARLAHSFSASPGFRR
ncbi:tetratricopeptide repeat protein [Nonomuraea sp. NPDC046570]|uniref:AfsR/SARP family transcriptional regulator n=1 Tax=Nonomuraea sp. NPDC046570 TaxID=3155255 RepID=UPI0033C22D98